MSLVYAAERGFAMGAKYGLVKGFRAYHSTEATPEMDETAMQGAIGIIIAVGGTLIALYIIAVVVGSISYAVTSGNIKLSPTWNTTITNIDSQAQATFNLAKRYTVFKLKSEADTGDRASDCNHRSRYIKRIIYNNVVYNVFNTIDPNDCDRGIFRPRNLIPVSEQVEKTLMPLLYRTLNTAIA